MARLPINTVYTIPIKPYLDMLEGYWLYQVAYPYNVTLRPTTAYEDLCEWVKYIKRGQDEFAYYYSMETPFDEGVPDGLRYEMLNLLDEALYKFVNTYLPIDTIYNPDIHITIENDYIFIVDARRLVYVPLDISNAITQRNNECFRPVPELPYGT